MKFNRRRLAVVAIIFSLILIVALGPLVASPVVAAPLGETGDVYLSSHNAGQDNPSSKGSVINDTFVLGQSDDLFTEIRHTTSAVGIYDAYYYFPSTVHNPTSATIRWYLTGSCTTGGLGFVARYQLIAVGPTYGDVHGNNPPQSTYEHTDGVGAGDYIGVRFRIIGNPGENCSMFVDYVKVSGGSFTPTVTPTNTLTPTDTVTPTPAVVLSIGNYLRDGSFDSNPDFAPVGLSPWNNSFWDVGRTNFEPADEYRPYLEDVIAGCGQNFYQLDPPPGVLPDIGSLDPTGTYVEQSFNWPVETDMYLSLMAKTSDPGTFGVITLITPDNSLEVIEPNLTNMSGIWQFFYWALPSADSGQYTLRVQAANVGTPGGHLAIDMAAVHEGYWHNDCGSQTEPYWTLNDSIRITATPGTPVPTQTLNAAFLTQLASDITQAVQATGTQSAISAATSTQASAFTATRSSVQSTSGWQTATKIAYGVQTLVAAGQGTQAVRTETAVAHGLTATQSFQGTATAFVANWRGTLTAAAASTATRVAIVQTQNAGALGTKVAVQTTLGAHATQTHIAQETQIYVPPIVYQLTLQAQMLATNAAILTAQAHGQSTAIANATATANATTEAQLTELAQVQATLQALATLQATAQVSGSGQVTGQATAVATLLAMPPLQNSPDIITADVDCDRPDNPYNLAWWIEYEVCRVLWYITPNQANMDQVYDVATNLQNYEPWGTFGEVDLIRQDIKTEFDKYDWNDTGLPGGNAPVPQIAANPESTAEPGQIVFMQAATDVPLLNGSIPLDPDDNTLPIFVTDCTTKVSYLLGPYITPAICYLVEVTRWTGYLPLIRIVFDIVSVLMLVGWFWKYIRELEGVYTKAEDKVIEIYNAQSGEQLSNPRRRR